MPFDSQPTLTGKLLSLRPLRPGDFDALYAVASDKLIWEQHPAWDRYKPEVFRALFDEFIASKGTLIATDLATGKVIGSSRYHGYNAEKSEVEIGWTFLARSHWGGVFNGEMKALMMGHAFRFVDSTLFMIGPENWRSRKAIEKIGGVFEGSVPRPGGGESVVYRIRKGSHPG